MSTRVRAYAADGTATSRHYLFAAAGAIAYLAHCVNGDGRCFRGDCDRDDVFAAAPIALIGALELGT